MLFQKTSIGGHWSPQPWCVCERVTRPQKRDRAIKSPRLYDTQTPLRAFGDGLGNDFAKWATEAGLPARCRLHGLKKSGMTRIANAGGSAHELMAISGHRTLSEVQRYTNDADRKRLADSGMARLSGQTENTNFTNIGDAMHKHATNTLKTKG
jgi:integrase